MLLEAQRVNLGCSSTGATSMSSGSHHYSSGWLHHSSARKQKHQQLNLEVLRPPEIYRSSLAEALHE